MHHSPKSAAVIPDGDLKVALRLEMSHLTTLWKQRTQDRCRLSASASKHVVAQNIRPKHHPMKAG